MCHDSLTDFFFYSVKKSENVETGIGGLLEHEEEYRFSYHLTSASCPSGTERNENFGMYSGREVESMSNWLGGNPD